MYIAKHFCVSFQHLFYLWSSDESNFVYMYNYRNRLNFAVLTTNKQMNINNQKVLHFTNKHCVCSHK